MNRFSRTWAICCIGLVSLIVGELFLPKPAKLWCGITFLVSFSSWCLFRCLREIFPKLSQQWFPLAVAIVSLPVVTFTFSTGAVQAESFVLFFSLVTASAFFPAMSISRASWWFVLNGYTLAWRCFHSSVKAIEVTNTWCPEEGYMDPEAATSAHFANHPEAVENTLMNCFPHATLRECEAFRRGWNAYFSGRDHHFTRFLCEPWIIFALACLLFAGSLTIVCAFLW